MIALEYIRSPFEAPVPVGNQTYTHGRRIRSYIPGSPSSGLLVFRNGMPARLNDVVRDMDVIAYGVPSFEAGTFFLVAFVLLTVSSIVFSLTQPKPRGASGDPERRGFLFTNTVGGGQAVGLPYGGPFRHAGHILESFQKPFLHVVPAASHVPSFFNELNTTLLQFNLPPNPLPTLHITVAIGHGPIESVTGLEIDSNPIATIKGLSTQIRTGKNDQSPIAGVDETVLVRQFNIAVTSAGGPQIVGTLENVDTMELTLRFLEGLGHQSNVKKRFRASKIDITFEYRELGQITWKLFQSHTIFAVTQSFLDINIRFPKLARAKYEIRVTRDTPDNPSSTVFDEFEIHELREITATASAHPGIALIGYAQVPLDKLSSVAGQRYTSVIKGLNDIRIYTTTTTFTTEWTSNPAWITADFLTRKEGLGRWNTWANINIAAFIDWAAYCDEAVDDGQGGVEKRCEFGFNFDQQQPAQDILRTIVSNAGATLLFVNNQWTVSIDRAALPVQTFTEGSIIGELAYSRIPRDERPTHIRGTFTNAEDNFQEDALEDFDEELPDLDIFNQFEVDLIGVNRPGQVARELRRLRNHAKFGDTAVKFKAGMSAMHVQVGSVFAIAIKDVRVGIGSGRILDFDATAKAVVLDDEVTLVSGKLYEITVVHQNDGIVDRELITSPDGTWHIVKVSDWVWTRALRAGDEYSIGEVGASDELFRCVDKQLHDDLTSTMRGIRYDERVYDFSNPRNPVTNRSVINSSTVFPEAVQGLVLVQRYEQDDDASVRSVIHVEWSSRSSSNAVGYDIYFREPDNTSAWIYAGASAFSRFEFQNPEIGEKYDFAIVPFSASHAKPAIDDSAQAQITTVAEPP